jgi:hypothetical protein
LPTVTRIRFASVALAVACAAAGGFAAGGDSIARPRSLVARRAALDVADERLTALFLKAKEDPRTARVEAYLAIAKPEDFANLKRPRVADIVEYLADEDAPSKLHERARDALKSITHRSLDPDLAGGEGANKRKSFCREKLVPLLARPGDKAEQARTLVAEILESYWHFPDPAIQRYNPKDDTTWRKAVDAYRKGLSR